MQPKRKITTVGVIYKKMASDHGKIETKFYQGLGWDEKSPGKNLTFESATEKRELKQ